METIVEGVLKARSRSSSGDGIVIRVLLGRPHWTIENAEAACPLAIEGLHGALAPIRGIDPFDALRNAVQMVERLLTKARDQYDIYWLDGDEHEPIE